MPKSRISQKQVKKVVNQVLDRRLEKKYYAPGSGFFNIDGSADITLGTVEDITASETQLDVADIPQGDGQGQRIGSEITMLSWKLNWIDHGSDSMYRLMVVHFPHSDGSLFAAALTANSMTTFAPSKKDFADSYRILYDKVHKLDVSEQLPIYRKINLPVKGLKVNYNDDATSLLSGQVRFYMITGTGAQGGVIGDVHGSSKLLYTDE